MPRKEPAPPTESVILPPSEINPRGEPALGSGREILDLGVVPLGNMLPEVAYIKLAWALGIHGDDREAVIA